MFFGNSFQIQQELLSLAFSLEQVCETQMVFISVKLIVQAFEKPSGLSAVLSSIGLSAGGNILMERTKHSQLLQVSRAIQ